MKTFTLEQVLEGARRASERVAKWPEWKRKLTLSRIRAKKAPAL